MTQVSTQDGPNQDGTVFRSLRNAVSHEVNKVVLGQQLVLDEILIALAVGGHVLLEGVPGTAKTLLANTTARALGLDFARAQFTPDMLPSDLTGTMTLRDRELVFRPGPIFTNVLLADEINRTPPKTQAALLEAMQERQVTVDGVSRELPPPFVVIATQNPIEYEGTYPLPEAQLDRFSLKANVGYPSAEEEAQFLSLRRSGIESTSIADVQPVGDVGSVMAARYECDETLVTPEVSGYVTQVVRASRELPSVEVGASPRASVHLLAVAKAVARLADRNFVTPDDVAWAATPVLAHRLVLSPEAELDGYSAADAVATVLSTVPVPR